MSNVTEQPADGDGDVRLSHRLASLHLAGLVFLVLVVVTSVLWVSAEHNRLARDASQRLVGGGVAAYRGKVDTLVRDYSIWDEAYAAVLADDRDWLYSNIGNAAAEIGTLDLIIFVNPATGAEFGWRAGTPPIGASSLLPMELLSTVLALLDGPRPARAIMALLDGEAWLLSAAYVTPVAGAPENVPQSALPRQIHGLRLSQARLDSLAEGLLIEGGLALASKPVPGQAALALADREGRVIAHLVWTPPQPGARILGRLAMPLAAALAFAGAVALFSSRYAVRSARRLERALDAARAADRLKSEFLSNVTHELRTPMNGIMGVAQLLEMTELDPEQRELVDVLDTSARAQMSLIGDLLDFARLEAGHRTLAPTAFDAAKALDEVGAMVRAGLAQKGVAFETEWRSLRGAMVVGDERAFRQIVTNLLGNAVKFTSQGRISARATLTRSGSMAEIRIDVSDTGVGISPAEIGRIFERFYRVDGSLARATEGAGLGLAISQRLAGLMGGRIEVDSRLGEGSTFTFLVSLPTSEAVTEPRRAASAPEPSRGPRGAAGQPEYGHGRERDSHRRGQSGEPDDPARNVA